MRLGFAIVALMLPLAGCVVPPYGGYSGYSGYSGYGGDYSYPGYSYNSGSPTYVVEGVRQPLVYYGGYWGYYDRYRRFQRAPDGLHRHLETRQPQGGGYRPYSGGYARPVQTPPYYGGYQGGYQPAAPVYHQPVAPVYRQAAPQPGVAAPQHTAPVYRQAAPQPGVAAPQHTAPQNTAQRPVQNSGSATGNHRRRDDDRR